MKKFKIKEQEIFANSLHDALEIYKHKVKDGRFVRFSGKSKSAQGYEVKGYCMTSEGRMYAVIYRPNVGDYLVAAGYNQQRGDWDQGYYDYKTEEQAIKKAEQLTRMYDSKPKDANWNSHVDLSDYLHDVLDDENIDYVSIGINFVTFDNIDDLEDAVFLLQRREGRKLKIDRKNLEVKILR